MAQDCKAKNIYRIAREDCGLSREKASEQMGIPPERIYRIETEEYKPYPDEILEMAECYKEPELCNYYCSEQCAIGQQYVPRVKIKDLSQIVLEILASMDRLQGKTSRLIDISYDGKIDKEELKDFVHIQKELERISITVETLQLWGEQMIATGKIDMEQYNVLMGNK